MSSILINLLMTKSVMPPVYYILESACHAHFHNQRRVRELFYHTHHDQYITYLKKHANQPDVISYVKGSYDVTICKESNRYQLAHRWYKYFHGND